MKVIAVFALVLAVALAAPQGGDKDAVVVKYNSDNIGVDGYNYDVETSNGLKFSEQGSLKDVGGDEGPAIVAQGSFEYKGDDGQLYHVSYVSDENGFQPVGEHLPHI